MITLLVITDGRRDCLQRTLDSFALCVNSDHIGRRVIVNDCPDPDYAAWIDGLGFDTHVKPLARRRGFGGAIAAGWAAIGDTDWIFHLEDDFLFTRHVDVRAMTRVLEHHPDLVQMALRRQPWNEEEKAAGGIVELHPGQYTSCGEGTVFWLEHRMFFTTNPCLYPKWVRDRSWPQCDYSEGVFTHQLFADPNLKSAFWGKAEDPPWVFHIGQHRTGTGY